MSGKRTSRKTPMEFSKKILVVAAFVNVAVIVFTFIMIWRTCDLSPLAYLIPAVAAETATGTGFYYAKAKVRQSNHSTNKEDITMVDLTQIVVAILTLVFSLGSAFLIPYIKTKVTAEQLETIKFWVNIAVEAAEMIYVGTGRGEEKKAYVVEFLNSKGFHLNTAEIDNIIEAAVLELKLATEKKEA